MELEINKLSRLIESMQPSREMLKLYEPARLIAGLQGAPWSRLLETEREFRDTIDRLTRLPEMMAASISETVSQSWEEAVESIVRGPVGLAEALDALRRPPTFIGHFDLPIPGEQKEDEDEDSDGAEITEQRRLPEEVKERLIRVEFLPLRVIRAIRQEPRMMRGLSSREFEGLVAELLAGLGFEDVELTPPSNDGGRDVVAVQRIHGIPILLNLECKRYDETRRIGPDLLRALLGTVTARKTRASVGVLVTTSTFTPGARDLFIGEPQLDGKEFEDVVAWVTEYLRRRK